MKKLEISPNPTVIGGTKR